MDELVNEILEELKVQIGLTDEADLSILKAKIKNAYRDIKVARNYPASYSETMIANDMEKFYGNVCKLALYDYNQLGVEGQVSYTDGGATYMWQSRSTCFEGVTPICEMA